jgi:NAD(P)-dependent dehydrogenase (short-subunit alcohol dehydrogenase family)
VSRPGRLAGKTAIVTGATEGIGAAVSRLFVREGARLVLVARRPGPGEALAAELGVVFVAGDIGRPETARAAVEAARGLGGPDVLVNNAGLDLSGIDLLETSEEDARRVFDVNVFGALFMLQEVAGAMRGRGGSIVNLTSRTASVGVPRMAVYSATKGALLALTRAAAIELAPLGIRVNAVAPGLTETPLVKTWIEEQDDPPSFRREVAATIPQGRFADPAEVAAAALFLASDESSHVTGVSLPVDGGYTAA